MAKKAESWTLDGHQVRVTNLDKLFWPDEELTKGDLLRYYREIAPVLLPYMRDRPFTMRAWPDGIYGKNFYRWRVPAHAPDWLERFVYQLHDSDKTAEIAVVDDPAELIWVCEPGRDRDTHHARLTAGARRSVSRGAGTRASAAGSRLTEKVMGAGTSFARPAPMTTA